MKDPPSEPREYCFEGRLTTVMNVTVLRQTRCHYDSHSAAVTLVRSLRVKLLVPREPCNELLDAFAAGFSLASGLNPIQHRVPVL